MAATPKRAPATEAALRGASLHQPPTWDHAIAALGADFRPISDHRASARYRSAAARGLLRKALMELGGIPTHRTRVAGIREGSRDAAS